METKVCARTLSEIAALVGGTIVGDGTLAISRLVPAGSDDPQGLAFAESDEYLADCLRSTVGAVIARRGTEVGSKPAIFVDSPRIAFVRLLTEFARPLPLDPGVHPTAVVSDAASVDPSASIGAFAVIESGAKVGAKCRVFPFCYVGEDCQVGDGSVLFPHSVLYQGVVLGRRCIVHSGAVIGADGFGYFWDGKSQAKVPQVGDVHIGDDTEIGANSCIDRATCGETQLGGGVKIDNLVQVGHNVVIGDHSVLASQTGIGGSASIGARVTLGGQVAISDHVEIADEVVLGGRSGAFQDITEPDQYFGVPPLPIAAAMRQVALMQKLPDMLRRVKALEDEIKWLRDDD